MTATIDDIALVVRLQLGLASVEPGDDLVEDLGAVSADIVNIIVALEDRFGIEAEEEALADLRTVADLHRLVESLQ